MASVTYHSSPIDITRISYTNLKKNLKSGILAYLSIIGGVVGLVAIVLLSIIVNPILAVVLGLVAAIVVFTYFTLPSYRLAIASAKGEVVTFKQLMEPNPGLSWRFIGTQLLAGLAILGGFILIIVPGVIFAGWFMYVPYVVLNEGLTGSAALGRSRQLARGRMLEGYGAYAITLLPEIFEFIPFVGTFFTIIAGFLLLPVTAVRYVELVALKAQDEETIKATKKSGLNWLVIVLALIISIAYGATHRTEPKSPGMTPANDGMSGMHMMQ